MIIQMRSNPKKGNKGSAKASTKPKTSKRKKSAGKPMLVKLVQNPLRKLLKNPLDGLKVAGVPVIPVAIGAATAILINSVAGIPQIKQHVTNEYAQKLVGPALAVIAGFAANKYLPQKWARDIGAQVVAAGVIFAAKALAERTIGDLVAKVLPGAATAAPKLNGFAGGMFGSDMNGFAGGAFGDSAQFAGGAFSSDLPMNGFGMLAPAYPMNGGVSLGSLDDFSDFAS